MPALAVSRDGTCVEFGPNQLPVNSFRVRVRVRAYRQLGGPESDTSAAETDGDALSGIRSKRRQVGLATRRNGDNLIGDNSVISATDSKNGEKADSQNGDNDRRRGGKREKEEGIKRITN